MHEHVGRIVAGLGAMALVAVSSARAQDVLKNGQTALLAALQRGDVAVVKRIESRSRVNPIIAKMADAQLRSNFPTLLRLAEKCESQMLNNQAREALKTAVYCNKVASATAMGLGNLHAFLQAHVWADQKMYPALKKEIGYVSQPDPPFAEPGFNKPDSLKSLMVHVPPPSETWISGNTRLRKVSGEKLDGIASVVRIKINGHSMPAAINTVVSGAIPLIVVEPLGVKRSARTTLGLKPVVAPPLSLSSSATARIQANFGTQFLADTVEVGPLVLHNLGVAVIRTSGTPAGVYITPMLLSRFGEVAFGEDYIGLYRNAFSRCSSWAPLVFAADSALDGHLQFPVRILGQTQYAGFDTLNSRELSLDRVLFGRSFGKELRESFSDSVSKLVSLTVGTQTVRVSGADLPLDWKKPIPVEIGVGVLHGYSVHMRFVGSSPTICFAPVTRASDISHSGVER